MTTFRTGNGAAWLDLLATLGGRYRDRQVDALDSPAQLRAWLRLHALEPTAAITQADVAATRGVREALHRTTVATLRGERPASADVRAIGHALDADRPVRLRREGAELTLSRPASAAEAIARLVRDAMQDLTGPQREHLHACGDETCSGIFLDLTGRRRWCSDLSCGNRMRVRAYRARVQSG